MNTRPDMNIGTVERATGLGKDTLRVWERRYGFPQPGRDPNGERIYSSEQVEKLRLIKRLIDQGHRPGRLFAANEEELAALSGSFIANRVNSQAPAENIIQQILQLVKANDAPALRQALQQAMLRSGLQKFIIDLVAPLNEAVGEAWVYGEFQIFTEHLYTEQMKCLLRQTIGNLPPGTGSPRVLLTTLPDEQHILGLLMVEALFALDGANCISLGTQTPIFDIQLAAIAHAVDIVAISFSAAFPGRQVAQLVNQLRQLLPAHVDLWVGGAGAQRVASAATVVPLASLQAGLEALSVWRRRRL